MTERLRLREEWRRATVKALFSGSDRDKLLCAIDIQTDAHEERERGRSIATLGVKYLFDESLEVKSVKYRGGRSYGPEGER